MIKNQWYAVLDSREVGKGKPIGVKRLGERLVFWRKGDGEIACVRDQCCHRGAALSAGKVNGDHVQCPFHGFQYDSKGKVVQIPANGRNAIVPDQYRVSRYIVKEHGGFIWLWWSEENTPATEIPFFMELQGFNYSQIIDPWTVHYSRCIENQLDVVHLPFVHFNTIGSGGQTLVNGPVTSWDSDTMTFYVYNTVDDGVTMPLKPDEIKDPEKLFHLKFRFPNLWQNMISDKIRIFAAFVPVDEENTVIYLRFYQKLIRVPVLSHIVTFFGRISSRVILWQDKRVVLTQFPKKTGSRMGEKLIQGDLPILEYRRRRDELIKAQENP